jgi:hypothetical protein
VHAHIVPIACTARITLELEPGADPIRGWIEHAGGGRQPFWGWLELSEELRRVAAGDLERPSQPTPANTMQALQPDVKTKQRRRQTTTKEQR